LKPTATRSRTEARFLAGLFACALALLSGCAQLVPQTIALRSGWPAGVPQTVEMAQVPFFPQEELQCGPAALATVLGHTGAPATPQQLAGQVFLPERGGSLQLEMLAAPRRWGRVAYRLAPSYPDLLREVAAGNPVVVLQDVGPLFTQWHYAVVNGFDYPSGTLYLRSGTKRRQEMPFTAFERSWMKSGYWAMVVTPPERIPATATEREWLDALMALARTDAPAAARGYEAALARWPDNLPAAVGLANHHHARGALADAAAVLRAAARRHPDSVILKNNLAQTLSDQGRHAEALALIAGIGDDSPFGADVKSTRAAIEQRLQESRAGAAR
jgi:hypothetical protein